MKKNILITSIVITGFSCTNQPMEQEAEKRKLEDKEIIQILRNSNKTLAVSALIIKRQEGVKSIDRFLSGSDTLVSFNPKNDFITIYGKGEKTYYRNHPELLQLCIKANSNDSESDDKNDTFEHSNREDYSSQDDAELLAKQESKKKCRCILI